MPWFVLIAYSTARHRAVRVVRNRAPCDLAGAVAVRSQRAARIVAAGQVNGSGGIRRVVNGYVRIADALDSQNRYTRNRRVAEQAISSRAGRIRNRGAVDERAGAARIARVAVERAAGRSQHMRGVYKGEAEPEITRVRWRAREGDRSRGAGGSDVDDRVTVVACYRRRAVVSGGHSVRCRCQ